MHVFSNISSYLYASPVLLKVILKKMAANRKKTWNRATVKETRAILLSGKSYLRQSLHESADLLTTGYTVFTVEFTVLSIHGAVTIA